MKSKNIMDALNDIDSSLIKEAQPGKSKKSRLLHIAAIAAAVCLLSSLPLFILFGSRSEEITPPPQTATQTRTPSQEQTQTTVLPENNTVATPATTPSPTPGTAGEEDRYVRVYLSAAPSFCIELKNDGTVHDLIAENDSAKEMLTKGDYKGKNTTEALSGLLSSMLDAGYLASENEVIQIYVECDEEASVRIIEEDVCEQIRSVLQTVKPDYSPFISLIDNKEVAKLAEEYGLSPRNAALVYNLIHVYGIDKSESECAKLSTKELLSLTGEYKLKDKPYSLLSSEAKIIALMDAGYEIPDDFDEYYYIEYFGDEITVSCAMYFQADLKKHVYTIHIEEPHRYYSCRIDAVTKEIISRKNYQVIGKEKAVEMAAEQFDLNIRYGGSVSVMTMEKYGKPTYRVTVRNSDFYLVDAQTGEVLLHGPAGTVRANSCFSAYETALNDAGLKEHSLTVKPIVVFSAADGSYSVKLCTKDACLLYLIDKYGEIVYKETISGTQNASFSEAFAAARAKAWAKARGYSSAEVETVKIERQQIGEGLKDYIVLSILVTEEDGTQTEKTLWISQRHGGLQKTE